MSHCLYRLKKFPAFLPTFFAILFFSIATDQLATAQAGGAAISGHISDKTGAIIRDAEVDIRNVDTNVVAQTTTNRAGVYSFPNIVPGNYVLSVHKQGFRSVDVPGLAIYTQDVLERNFTLEVGSISESVTVTPATSNASPAVSMTVSQEFVDNMPLNGRSFQDLVQLAPGTVSTNGYYSVDGQRIDANNYMVDGVSANLGGSANKTTSIGAALSGAAPAQTLQGTTQSLASVDSLQEFTIQTSGYTAEFGRNPGGQVQFTTRSGTNDIHGTLSEYLRNTAFDANTYTNKYEGYPKTAEHQNDFGGTVGGPLIIPNIYDGKGRTFYFASYEGLRLLVPAFESEYVPTQAFRKWASPNVQPFLGSIPLPNSNPANNNAGCDPSAGQLSACAALFNYGYSYPSNLDSMSIRLDQNIGRRVHTFVRYSDTPSSSTQGAETAGDNHVNSHTATLGLTVNLSDRVLSDLRINLSRDGENSYSSLRSIGGSVPYDRSLIIPPGYDSPYDNPSVIIYVPGTSIYNNVTTYGSGSDLNQFQMIESLSWTRGTHSTKFGGDWRRISSFYTITPYSVSVSLESLDSIQQGYAQSLGVSAIAPGVPVFDNLSLFVQDHWRANSRFSLDYGLRWEFNPPPGPSSGHYPIAITTADLLTATVAPSGTPLYHTHYNHFAPRIGFAWNAVSSQNHPITVRGAFGIFYDTGQQSVGNQYTNLYPFKASRLTQTDVPLPLSAAELAPPVINFSNTAPYPFITVQSPDLTLPYTLQWNLSLDEQLNSKNTLTVSYVGNKGTKLLFPEVLDPVLGNSAFASGIEATINGSQSSYNALQIQDTGRIVHNLDIVGSFTLAHALDNLSSDYVNFAPTWGNADFDVRRVLNLAINYQTQAAGVHRWLQGLSRGWLVANRFSTQSGSPVPNFYQARIYTQQGLYEAFKPDLVRGVPIYLHGREADVAGKPVAASWRLNPEAFACVPTNSGIPCVGTPIRQGTLGRNYVRNPSFWALNTALQRNFRIHDQLGLNFRGEAFNIFNHPNPVDPYVGSLTNADFGIINGSASTIGSSNTFYAMGSSRSLQFSLKLQF